MGKESITLGMKLAKCFCLMLGKNIGERTVRCLWLGVGGAVIF